MAKNHAHSVDAAIDRLEREEETGEERYVDLAMAFIAEPANDNADVLLMAGGRWDRRLGDFDGEATHGVLVHLHPGQRRAIEWFRAWLGAHEQRRQSPPPMPAFDGESFELDTDPAHAYSALFAGGRRGGKTWIAVAIAVVYAVMYPNAIVWIVSPNNKKHEEVRRYLATHIADEWLERQTAWHYDFINGSTIELKSGHDPELLKEGKANLVVLNEGQMMSQRAFVVCRGAIVDQSGLVIVCANPPQGKKDQQWVTDFAAEAAAGRRAAVYLEFNPLLNPHIDRVALLSFKSEIDQRAFDIEVLGLFRGPEDAVAYNWVRLENEIAVPPEGDRYRDVTTEFLELLGEGEGLTHLVGLDVQRFPHIGGPWYKFFLPVREALSTKNVLVWIVGETVLDGGDEVDFCEALRASGRDPEQTLIVCDASGQYQHSRRRSADAPPPEWKGRGSFDIIRGAGFRRIVPPDRRMKKNPEIVDRMRAFTSMICTGAGVRRLFADPVKAPKTCAAIRDWRTKHGLPSRTSDHAHLGDAASYPIVRLFPRRLRAPADNGLPSAANSGNQQPVRDPVASRVDRVAAVPQETRIIPPTFGPSTPRRGSRVRGL